MRSYLSLIPISAKVHKRKNWMTLFCIIIAVFLVTVVFSMVETAIEMEKNNLIQKHGKWHVAITNVSDDVIEEIYLRSDVDKIAWLDVINKEVTEEYSVQNEKAVLYGVDQTWITGIRDCLKEGTYPQYDNEVMLSSNAKTTLNIRLGDRIILNTPSGSKAYKVSGFGEHDLEFNKLYDAVTVYMNKASFSKMCEAIGRDLSPEYYIHFKTDAGVRKKIENLKETVGLTEENIKENTGVLGIIGYSNNQYAQNLYPMAGILFLLILMAAIFMISSSMNSNVAERTQFFGMLRCIGMSKQQVIRFVRWEALNWCKTAIPIGILLGTVTAWLVCIWLRNSVGGEFIKLPLFHVSVLGIVLGAVVGISSVVIAARTPAKRAAKVSPIMAVSSNIENTKMPHRAMRIGGRRIETVLGIHHAIVAKKNLILMAGSFSLSIILFFGFSAGLDFVKRILPSTRVWQPDFVISCEDEKASVDKDLVTGLRDIDGVSHVFGNMAALDIPVTGIEDTSRITLVSYEEYMFQCAKNHMVSGDFSKISKDSNYVLLIYNPRSSLKVGEVIQINGMELEIAGIVSEGLFEDDTTLICTEETFERLMGKSGYSLINIQFKKNASDRQVQAIRNLLESNYNLGDYRESNKETIAEYWAFRFLVYAFFVIIVLIAFLNILNSTSMSVSAKIKQYGVMRAIGMDGCQLTRMIAMEVFTYASIGCGIGCVLGLQLNKLMFEKIITEYFGETWHIPFEMIGIIIFIVMVSVVVAVYVPTKRIRNMDITACISEV